MGKLTHFVRICKSWTLRALGRPNYVYDSMALSLLKELEAAMRTAGSPAAAAPEAAACSPAVALRQFVHEQPCEVAAAVVEKPHILQQLLNAAFCSSNTICFNKGVAADVLLLLTVGHFRLAEKAAARSRVGSHVRAHSLSAATAAALEAADDDYTGEANAEAAASAAPCCCTAAAQLLELLCEHVQLLVDAAVGHCASCSSTGAILLSRMATAAPSEALAGQLLQLVVEQQELAVQRADAKAAAEAAALAGKAAAARTQASRGPAAAAGAQTFRSCTDFVSLSDEGSYPMDIEQEQSKQAARACDAAFSAAHTTKIGAALEALTEAACCRPDAVSSALLQYSQGLQVLIDLIFHGVYEPSEDSISRRIGACLGFMALSVLRSVTGTMCGQRDMVLAALAAEKSLYLLLDALPYNNSCAADLLCCISQAPEVQQQLLRLAAVTELLGVVCGQEASLEVRTAAATALANLGHSAAGRQAVSKAVQQHSVGPLVQLLQQQGSSAALASSVAWILEAASTAPAGELLLLPYAAELAGVAVQRHRTRFHSSTVDDLALQAAVWVCRLAGKDDTAVGAAEEVLCVVLDQF
jgi:hypothetical protein